MSESPKIPSTAISSARSSLEEDRPLSMSAQPTPQEQQDDGKQKAPEAGSSEVSSGSSSRSNSFTSPTNIRFQQIPNKGRFVRFPVDREDNVITDKSRQSLNSELVVNRLKNIAQRHGKSGLSSPPIINNEDAKREDVELDYFSPHSQSTSGRNSPAVLLTRPDNSQVNLQLYQGSNDSVEDLVEKPQPAMLNNGLNALSNIFDVGLYTSAGSAPGAINYGDNAPADGPDEELKVKRDELLKSIESYSAPQTRSTSPKMLPAEGAGENSIPLMDLTNRLNQLCEDPDTREIAKNLVRSHTLQRQALLNNKVQATNVNRDSVISQFDEKKGYVVPQGDLLSWSLRNEGIVGGTQTPPEYRDGTITPHHEDYVARPEYVKQGVLGSLLKLYSDAESAKSSTTLVPSHQQQSSWDAGFYKTTASDTNLPKLQLKRSSSSTEAKAQRPKWYNHKKANQSTASLGGLVLSASTTLGAPGSTETSKYSRPPLTKRISGGIGTKNKQKMKLEDEIKITVHIADVLQRQRFLLRMCRALMMYGAPTHRLEEYMKMTSRVLEINGQYLYIPGCMIVSFGDPSTHTSEMQLVRCVQGLNLDKLQKTHQIYKEVVHDMIGVEEASQRIDELLSTKSLYPPWLCVLFFGLATAIVTPWAFGGWWLDMPISFLLGLIVGFLQIYVAPKSDLYSNVFEVTSSIIVSFIARALGSIGSNQDIFCFSAIAQGSLALILPGYIILCGSLELQSKNIVAGSVRMFYAIIYSCEY
jgi:uncharacterized membrane protein YjjP (DUF1212 family)